MYTGAQGNYGWHPENDETLDQDRISRNNEKLMDIGHIQEATSIEMGDGFDAVDEKDRVKDGSQVSASCWVVTSGAYHRAGQQCKRTRYGEERSVLGCVEFEWPLRYPCIMPIM